MSADASTNPGDDRGASGSEAVRVFLVDRSDPGGGNLRTVLQRTHGIALVGEADPDAPDVAGRVRMAAPHVAIVRVDDHARGVQLCRELGSLDLDVQCLVLTSLDGDDALTEALLAGAVGHLRDDLSPDDVAQRVHDASRGHSAVREWVERQSAAGDEERDLLASLTYRERTVVRHVVRGLTNRQIGAELGLAEKTVRNYVSNILTKLDLDNRTQLAVHLARAARDGDAIGSR